MTPYTFLVVVVVRPHGDSEGFFLRLAALVSKHAKLGPPGAPSFLPTDPFDPLFFGGPRSRQLRLDFIQKDSSREKTVEGLGALLLTLNPNARGPMVEQHAGGLLVDVLAACAGGPDKLFLQVSLPDSQGTHAADQLFFFFGRNHKQRHRPSFVAQRTRLGQGDRKERASGMPYCYLAITWQ